METLFGMSIDTSWFEIMVEPILEGPRNVQMGIGYRFEKPRMGLSKINQISRRAFQKQVHGSLFNRDAIQRLGKLKYQNGYKNWANSNDITQYRVKYSAHREMAKPHFSLKRIYIKRLTG